MNQRLYLQVLGHVQIRLPPGSVRSFRVLGPGVPVPPSALFFDWVVVSQRRYYAASRAKDRANSVVAVRTGATTFNVGELVSIFAFQLAVPQLPHVRLGLVRFLRPVENAFHAESAWRAT
jgi:hypothetical protein